MHQSKLFRRIIIYLAGIIILAFGITLNTKTGLGVSPIVSVAYCISVLTGINFGTMTFFYYVFLVFLQILLLRKDFKVWQLLQVAASLFTSVFIDLFDRFLPMADNIPLRIGALMFAIIFTGLGASMTVSMKIVPNPADGFANALGQKLKRGFGFGKNVFDLSSIIISLIIGWIACGSLLGIGIGTIVAMIFTGRVVAFCQRRLRKFYEKIVPQD